MNHRPNGKTARGANTSEPRVPPADHRRPRGFDAILFDVRPGRPEESLGRTSPTDRARDGDAGGVGCDRASHAGILAERVAGLTGADLAMVVYRTPGGWVEAHIRYVPPGRSEAAGFASGSAPVPTIDEAFSTPGPSGLVRHDDVAAGGVPGPRSFPNRLYRELGMRSHLATPVVGADGAVLARVFLGHRQRAWFSAVDEARLMAAGADAGPIFEAASRSETARASDAGQRDGDPVRRHVTTERGATAAKGRLDPLFQGSLLPSEVPRIPGVDLAGRFLPAAGSVGGDFYDVFPVGDGEWGLAIGDVCGKGSAAAVVTGLVRRMLRAAATGGMAPGEVLRSVNDALSRADVGEEHLRLCTLAYGRLSRRGRSYLLDLASGGHPPALVVDAHGAVSEHGPTGPMLGVVDAPVFDEETITLDPGDRCLLYTDGATEVRRGAVFFTEDRLAHLVRSSPRLSAEAVAMRVERAVVDFQHGVIGDDLAVVVLAIPGMSASERSPRR